MTFANNLYNRNYPRETQVRNSLDRVGFSQRHGVVIHTFSALIIIYHPKIESSLSPTPFSPFVCNLSRKRTKASKESIKPRSFSTQNPIAKPSLHTLYSALNPPHLLQRTQPTSPSQPSMHLLILSQAAFFAWLAASLPLREAMPFDQLSERTLPNRNVDVPVDAPIDLVKRQSDLPLSLSFDVPISITISEI